ncbi:hypothetical protein G7Y79_00005g016350 [Physcia stellaris]|nr:hypothetical protein G7Y79_00005g016350 [Physcia stellaris]
MPPTLLSLPPELLTQISNLVLLPSSPARIRVSPPRARFTYDDAPPRGLPSKDSAPALMSPLQTPPSHTNPATPCDRSTRSTTSWKLRSRPYNPHRTSTTISLLLVCRHLHALGAQIYYGRHQWYIGLHARSPTIQTFRSFLGAIGPLARAHIRTVVVLSSYGYECFWEGLPRAWIVQLQRCTGIRAVIFSMSCHWAKTIIAKDERWKNMCAETWENKGPGGVKVVAECSTACKNFLGID